MAYFEIADFKAGVDVRRSPFTSVPGTLQKLVNAHITRGGDVERRKVFDDKGYFAGNTFGLSSDMGGLVTFGSDAAPWQALPPGVRYQQLVAPGSPDMVSVDAAEQFGGKLYVAATFSDGQQWHFYDGQFVGDWGGGVVSAHMVDNAGIAQHIADIINGGGIYTATRAGTVLTITGPDGVAFESVATTANRDGGNPNQDIVISEIQQPIPAVPESRAVGAFAVVAGQPGAGNRVLRVTVDPDGTPLQLLTAPVPYGANARATASSIAEAINNGTHGYLARADAGSVLLTTPIGVGSGMNNKVVEIEVEGRVCLADGSFSITAGAVPADELVSVRADGKDITSTPIPWAGSNTATAEAVAADINSHPSVPKFVAAAIGGTVYVSPKLVRSDGPSSITMLVTTTGDFSTDPGFPPPEGPPGGGGGGYDPRPTDPHDEIVR